jgi:hypothetical protein
MNTPLPQVVLEALVRKGIELPQPKTAAPPLPCSSSDHPTRSAAAMEPKQNQARDDEV